jgi:hypothetical protein
MKGGGGGEGKIRTRHNVNGEDSRIASRLGPCNFTAILRARNIDLPQGERASDVKGGEDDWEGEGELHVCSNRCSTNVGIYAIEKGPIYPLQSRELVAILSAKCHPRVGIPCIGTWHYSFFVGSNYKWSICASTTVSSVIWST